MLQYISSQHRQRTRQFDTYVAAGLAVLGNPNVAEFLGEADKAYLRSSLETAVLPNVRHNRISIPLSKVLLDSPVIVPADEELYPRTWALFDKSLASHIATSAVYEGDTVYSARYKATYPRMHEPKSNDDEADSTLESAPTSHEKIRILANTTCAHFMPTKKAKCWRLGRPFVRFRPELLEDREDYIGALALHEAVHIQDFTEHGPVASVEYKVVTEVRAYQLEAFIAEEYEQDDSMGVARAVEAQRRARATAEQQYPVDADYVQWMAERKLITA